MSHAEKRLFTPGPLTTSDSVKAAMQQDLGSRDDAFIDLVRQIRQALLALGGVTTPAYTAIIMQGSGTFGIESVISSITPPAGKWLMLINGAYGWRMAQITTIHHIPTTNLIFPENQTPTPADVAAALAADPSITHVGVVHCETTTGIFNPVRAIGAVVFQQGRQYVVDAMSSFGAVPLNLAESHIDYLISSANKCIEGVPGFSFVLARQAALLETTGWARTLSLDLLAQWQGLEANGQFRFTPPTHVLLAFRQALAELAAEGGAAGRAARYRRNYEVLVNGMRQLGFREYLAPTDQGHIITSFRYPTHPRFSFTEFYQRLNARGFVIYPGKVSDADCFRIGHIGQLFPHDMQDLLAAIQAVLEEMYEV